MLANKLLRETKEKSIKRVIFMSYYLLVKDIIYFSTKQTNHEYKL